MRLDCPEIMAFMQIASKFIIVLTWKFIRLPKASLYVSQSKSLHWISISKFNHLTMLSPGVGGGGERGRQTQGNLIFLGKPESSSLPTDN